MGNYLEDMNVQLIGWLGSVANARTHGTTQRIVAEAFAAEQSELQNLPDQPFGVITHPLVSGANP